MGWDAANLHLTLLKPNQYSEECYFLITGLPPNTHTVGSRCADRSIYLHIKTCMLSELLAALASWEVSSFSRFSLLWQALSPIRPKPSSSMGKQSCLSSQADKGYFCPLLLVSCFHQFYSGIIHYYAFFFIMSYCKRVDSKSIFKSYGE